MILHFLNNPFLGRDISEDKMDNISLIILERMKTNNQTGLFTTMIAATQPLYDVYHESLTLEALDIAIKEGKTITVDSAIRLLKDFASKKEVDINYHFRKGTPDYEEFYPHGRKEYSNANRKNASRLFERLLDAYNAHTAVLGTVLRDELQQKLDAYKNARNIQLQAIGEVYEISSESDQFRYDLAIQLYRNLGLMISMYADNPERIKDIIPEAKKSTKDKKNPAPVEKIKITMASDQTNPDKVLVGYKGSAGKIVDTVFGDGNSKNTTMDGIDYVLAGNTYVASGNYTITAEVEKSALDGIVASGDMLTAVNHPDGLDAEEYDYSNNLLTSIFFLPTNTRAKRIDVSGNNLDQQSMNLIMMTADGWGTENGYIKADGGTNAAPSGQGIAAMNQLIARGWTVITN